MNTILTLTTVALIFLNVCEELFAPKWLPLGKSQMAQMGIVFFCLYGGFLLLQIFHGMLNV